jgi:hypothetical protein
MDPTKTKAEEAEPGKAEVLERAKAEAVVKARLEVEHRMKARAESQTRPAVEQAQQEHQSAEEKYRQRIEEKERQRIAEEDRRRAEAEELRLAADEDRQRVEEKERQRLAEEDRQRAEAEERQRAEDEERKRVEAEERQRAAEEEERKRLEEERQRIEAEERQRAEEEERKRVEAEERQRAAEEEERKRVEEEERQRVAEEEKRKRIEEEERKRAEEEERRHTEEERQHYLEQQALLKAEAGSRGVPAPTQPVQAQPTEAPVHGTAAPRPTQVEAAGGKAETQAAAETSEHVTDGAAEEPASAEPGWIARLPAAGLLAAKQVGGRLLAARALVSGLLAGRLRRRGTWIALFALGVLAALAVAVVQIQRLPLDVASFEKAAADRLGEPVRIGALHIALLPRPHLRLENIEIGKEQQIRITSMKAVPEIGAILSRRMAFTNIDIDRMQLPQAFVARTLWGKGDDHALRVDRVTVTNLTLELQGKTMPGFYLEAVFWPAGLQSAELNRAENDLVVTLQVDGDKTQVEVSAQRLKLPFADRVELEALSAKGTANALGLDFTEFSARSFDGDLRGSARLAWRNGWSFEGKISAAGMDATRLGLPVLSGGRLDGQGNYAMRAAAPEKLLDALHLDGSFTVRNGIIANIDLTRLVQRESAEGGNTSFSELSGSVLAEEGRVQLRQLKLAAGSLSSGGGVADIDAQGNLSGRMLLQMHTESTLGLALLGIAGTLKQPQFSRSL